MFGKKESAGEKKQALELEFLFIRKEGIVTDL